MVGGLLLLAISFRAFHQRKAERDGARQQLREEALGLGRRGGLIEVGGGGSGSLQPSELGRYCEEHFGLEWVRRWGATARQVCSATQQLAGVGGLEGSTVTCRSINDTHMPAASAPHVLCDATNLRFNASKMVRSVCAAQAAAVVGCQAAAWAFCSGATRTGCHMLPATSPT